MMIRFSSLNFCRNQRSTIHLILQTPCIFRIRKICFLKTRDRIKRKSTMQFSPIRTSQTSLNYRKQTRKSSSLLTQNSMQFSKKHLTTTITTELFRCSEMCLHSLQQFQKSLISTWKSMNCFSQIVHKQTISLEHIPLKSMSINRTNYFHQNKLYKTITPRLEIFISNTIILRLGG